jgi:hypothetical protein
MAQVWFTFQFLVMVAGLFITDGNQQRNIALGAILALIGLASATRLKRR